MLLAVLVSLAKKGSATVRLAIGVVAGGVFALKPTAPRMVTVPGACPPVSTPIWKVTGEPPASVPCSGPWLQTMRVGVPTAAAQNAGRLLAVVPAGRSKMLLVAADVSPAPFSSVMP